MIVVVMGVAGSGKTTVATMLADAMRCPFLEGDSLHPASNVEKMSRGIPLTNADRAPSLAAIRPRLPDAFERQQSLVVACSALTQSSRTILAEGIPINWVYLQRRYDAHPVPIATSPRAFHESGDACEPVEGLGGTNGRDHRRRLNATVGDRGRSLSRIGRANRCGWHVQCADSLGDEAGPVDRYGGC